MNFSRHRTDDSALEINVIPLIDILLVMVIFLASTTAFTRYSELEVVLPEAQTQAETQEGLNLAISQDGRYALDGKLIEVDGAAGLADVLSAAVAGRTRATLTINADGQATHQAVVAVMEAARLAGIERINFATRTGL